MISYFWDSATHLEIFSLAFESLAGIAELILAICFGMAIFAFRSEPTEEAKNKKERLEAAFGLVAAVAVIFAILAGWRILVLFGQEKIETDRQFSTVTNLLNLATNGVAEAKQEASKNDPLNQPLVAVTATASIHVKGTNFVNISDFDKFPNNHFVTLSFMHTGQEDWKLHLICKSSERIGGADDTWWFLEFGGEPEAPSWNLGANDLVRLADEWDIVSLDAVFIRSDAEILGGEVRLLLNGAIKKNFPIPPQKPEPLFGIAYKDLPVMNGTTSNKVNVRVVGTPGPPIKK